MDFPRIHPGSPCPGIAGSGGASSYDVIAMSTTNEAIEILSRGVEGLYSLEQLKAMLASDRLLRVKLGLDPTAPDFHLGHSVVLKKMRQFQDLGHQAVLIIGDYTARIGDPSGRDTTRPVLDGKTVERNAQTYLDQAAKILDTSAQKLEIRWNSEWLSKLTFADVLRLTGTVTVQQMLHRESFKLRMQNDTEIVLSEFLYPLMQAYDSVVIKADVELGGTDQTFNCLAGRELMAKLDLPRQVVLVMPLLVGLDGREKMSKSKGNTIDLTDPPDDMFGKVMSIPDEQMGHYFTLCTDLPEQQVAALLDPQQTHPRQAKDMLGRVVVESLYDRRGADAASAEFRRRFREGQLPSDMQTKAVPQSPIGIVALVVHVGFASSNNEARRLVQQGGVTFADQKIADPKAQVSITGESVLKVGKRRVCKVVVGH